MLEVTVRTIVGIVILIWCALMAAATTVALWKVLMWVISQ